MRRAVYVIAEAGVNHNGDISLALKLVQKAKEAGADAVKFQTFKAKNLVTKEAQKANYQIQNTGEDNNQLSMLQKLELSENDHVKLISECERLGIEFLSTPFDDESIKLLKSLGMKTFKIPSGELNNTPYLRKVAQNADHVILSTGMGTIDEVKFAFDTLVKAGQKRENITILHATTEYPCPLDEVNLEAMLTIKSEIGCQVGYSDHTQGILVPVCAAAMGASIIEKHFTLDRNLPGPDHKSSLEPGELIQMVQEIRKVESFLGDGEKKPTASELKNIGQVRKSIVAKKPILEGEKFSDDNLTTKRPANGLNPALFWDKVLGTTATQSYEVDDLIRFEEGR